MALIPRERLKQNLAFAALILFALLLAYLLRDFLTSFLGAVIFYVLFKPFMHYLTHTRKWNKALAATLIIVLSFIIILIPILSISYMLYSKLVDVINNPHELIGFVQSLDKQIQSLTGFELLSDDTVNDLKGRIGLLIPSFLGQMFYTIGNIAIMYFILYYMLVESERMTRELNHYLPFDIENIRVLSNELDTQTKSNAVAVPLVAIVQGATAGLGYWLFGVPEPVFWGAMTAFLSILPLLGTTLVWLPAGVLLIASGHTWPGLGLIAYGIAVVVNIDNVARFMIQKKFADVHPIITVFGVVIGLDLFGVPGLIFGPLMMSYFIILVKMYRRVYHVKDMHS